MLPSALVLLATCLLLAASSGQAASIATASGSIVNHAEEAGVRTDTLSSGFMHTCGIKSDGTIACWGPGNSFGQQNAPTGTFTQVSAGEQDTCGIKTDGTLACWGDNSYGQATPPTGTFTQVSAGRFHTCGLKTNGTIACWGENSWGQLNAPEGTTFIQVRVGINHSCGLRTDGTLACWGLTYYDMPGTFTQIYASFNNTCGLKTDGTIVCWGDNSKGQLNIPNPQDTFTQVKAAWQDVCGLKTNGTLACWGGSNYLQVIPSAVSFTQISLGESNACGLKPEGTIACWEDPDGEVDPPGVFSTRQLSAGAFHTCEIRTDGKLACWGDNSVGQLNNIPTETFAQVSAGWGHTCGLKTDGTLACWGTNNYGPVSPPTGSFTQVSAGVYHTCGLKTDGTLACWGNNGSGESSPPNDTFTQVSAGWGHTCGLKTNGTLTCWGDNYNWQLNIPNPADTFTQVSTGSSITCGLKTNSTLACWGNNRFGQLNIPNPADTFTQVSAGIYHVCGLKTNGTLVCWGWNNSGQLNIPNPADTFTQVSAGNNNTCGQKTDGTVICWGDNNNGKSPQAAIGPDSLTDGDTGNAYSQQLTFTAANSTPAATAAFKLAPGSSLPDGLSLSPVGLLSGTPTASGDFSFTVAAQDDNGFAATRTYPLHIINSDTTPPVITPMVTGSSGSNGWYVGDVTIGWSVTDPESTVSSSTGCSTVTLTTDSIGTTYTCEATSAGGPATQSVTVKRDATAPTIALASRTPANANGWNNTTVTVNWSCGDSGSGVEAAATSQTVSSEGGNQSATGTCTDNAGNTSTDTQADINIDTTAPVLTAHADITVTAPAATGATANYMLPTATETLSGINSVSCAPASGSLFPLGTTTVACTATDRAGNSSQSSFKVNVAYSWSGVLQPVNVDGSSVFKLGSTVPVKFQFTVGSAGVTNAVAKLSYVQVANSVPGIVNEAVSTSAATTSNLFRYEGGQYLFNWSTKGLSSGTYQLQIDLGDGVSRTVNVSLK